MVTEVAAGPFSIELGISTDSIINAGRYDVATGVLTDTSRFNLDDAKLAFTRIREGYLDSLGEEDAVKSFLGQIENDGMSLNGLAIGGRGLSIASLVATAQPNEDYPGVVPNAVARIEVIDPPLDHPIVIKEAYFKKDTDPDSHYKLYVVPYAPDIPNPDAPEEKHPTNEDILRTIRVLKASGKDAEHPNGLANNVWDFENDNFVFLKNLYKPDDVLRYPEGEKYGDFSNKPIAFLRDLNASGAKKEPMINGWLQAKIAVEGQTGEQVLSALPEAPKECVEACKQQYAITAELSQELKKAGIAANVEIPTGKISDEPAKITEEIGAEHSPAEGRS